MTRLKQDDTLSFLNSRQVNDANHNRNKQPSEEYSFLDKRDLTDFQLNYKTQSDSKRY